MQCRLSKPYQRNLTKRKPPGLREPRLGGTMSIHQPLIQAWLGARTEPGLWRVRNGLSELSRSEWWDRSGRWSVRYGRS